MVHHLARSVKLEKEHPVYRAAPLATQLILLVFEEFAYRHRSMSFCHAAIVAFTTPAFAGKHGLGTCLVLLEFHMLVDGKRLGHCLNIEVVSTNQCEGPVLLLQFLNQLTNSL